ncbi:sigma factor-like helix-turn-helix DNA-binding protein [Streptomyces sp. NPDC051921]|uniref:sigma factor-like helix-turn-helix DNA-binding protein n=1 Tax=Streptomyces sp. NPDC051921 TaxID=3155806 RepID=UPI0034216268
MSPTSPSFSLPSPKERRRLREALSLSEDQVAEALGVTRSTVRSWETGRSAPRGRKREAYAKLLGIYEEPASPEPEKPARPSPAQTRPRAAAKGTAGPPKTPPASKAGPAARAADAPRPPEGRPQPAGSGAGAPEAAVAHADRPAPLPATAPSGSTAPASTDTSPGAAVIEAPPVDATPTGSADAVLSSSAAGVPTSSADAVPTGSAAGVPSSSADAALTTSADAAPTGSATTVPTGPATAALTASDDARASVDSGRAATSRRDATSRRRPADGPAFGADAGATVPEGGAGGEVPEAGARDGLTAEEAFDALYAYAAPSLVHQAYLLTGRRSLSRESVEHAFHYAWQHWPEVAVDRDPVGWVRAAAYEYALSPWHRFRRRHRHPDAPPAEASRRALLDALLELPPPYRRTVLLYDGLGLDLPETAAETEASTPAAGNRLLHARSAIAQRLPELADPELLHDRLSALVAEAPTPTLPAARSVRSGSERRARRLTRAVFGVSVALIGVTAFTVATAPTRYVPVNAPGEVVEGVPVRGGPQKLRPQDKELLDMLRTAPHPGPERLVPTAE